MADTFRIVLRDLNHHDTFETREFDLPLGSTHPVGRASRSVAKRDLMPAPHNLYIDSPVISREHAVLSASLHKPTPHVSIADRGSMHGTMVNGRKLLPNTPEILRSGDVLQFGVDVNRNEEFFVARKYAFESQLARPYSLGFAVPDAESEEEHVDAHRQHGSQLNPLILDDSDADSDVDRAAVDDEDVTMIDDAQLKPSNLDPSELVDADDAAAEDLLAYETAYIESAIRLTAVAEDYSDAEESVQYSSDDENGHGVDTESVASSEEHHTLEPEVPDSDDDHDDDDAGDDDVSSPIVSKATDLPSKATLKAPELPHSYAALAKSRNAFTLDDDVDEETVSEIPLAGSTFGQNHGSDPYAETAAPPLPPRPAQHAAEPTNPYTYFTPLDNRNWPHFTHPQLHYMDTNFEERPSLFSAPPLPSPFGESTEYYPRHSLFGDSSDSARQALSLQTPPPMPASDVVASTPQPVRRTKVSIEEIVEDQPPTPESVNSMKRKADVLEEEHTPAAVDPLIVLPESTPIANQVVADVSVDQTAALIAQRPKKQPRSVLAKFSLTVKYLGFGTAGALAAITALSTLPDTFFM